MNAHQRLRGGIRARAYAFDGEGNYREKEWDLQTLGPPGKGFCWYHVELPRRDERLSASAQRLVGALCPPLTLRDILALASTGPYCGHVGDDALVFRVNSPGPLGSHFTVRLAARIAPEYVVTVSLGRVPRLGFERARHTVLSEVPAVAAPEEEDGWGDAAAAGDPGRTPIEEHVLEFFLTMDHRAEQAESPVPATVSSLVAHVVESHVDHIEDVVTGLELELDSVELELDRGGYALKKQMLDDRRFAKLHLDLQRLLQVVAHSEQVFPRVKEKCASKTWFAEKDTLQLEELIGRLRRIKENLGFIVNRVTAIQANLDSWQSEEINRKLYYLSFISMIFLPLSIITGIFGMNVGGVPWTGQGQRQGQVQGQRTISSIDGFRNVMLICAVVFFIPLLAFSFHALYTRISAWRKKGSLKRSRSLNRKSPLRSSSRTMFSRGEYTRL